MFNPHMFVLVCSILSPNKLSQDGTGFPQDTPRPCVKLCKAPNLNRSIPSRVAWDGRMGFCAPRYKRPVAKKASVSWIRTRNGRGPHGFHCPCRLVPPISTVVYYGSTDVIWLIFLAISQRPQPISVNDCDSTRKDSIIEEMDNVFELCM